MRPHRQQPTRLPCPWDSPGKNTGVGCHFLLQCMKVESESRKSLCHVWLLATPWTAAHQAPLPMGFFRQEYWSGVPLPSPQILDWVVPKSLNSFWAVAFQAKGRQWHSLCLSNQVQNQEGKTWYFHFLSLYSFLTWYTDCPITNTMKRRKSDMVSLTYII